MPTPANIQEAVNEARAILSFTESASIIVAAILGGSTSAIWLLRQKRLPNWRETFSTILFATVITVGVVCAFLYFGNIPMLLVIPVSILTGFGAEVLGRALINLWVEFMVRVFGPGFLKIFGLKAAPPLERRRHRDEHEADDEI